MADSIGRSPIRWGDSKSEWQETTPTYQSEIEEWIESNRNLKQHGLPGIKILHPSDVTLMTDRTVSFDVKMSRALRENLLSLMADCDHRQTLIQDLILNNNKLKEDLAKQGALTDKYYSRMKDLKVLLESSRARVQELEQEEDAKSSFYADEEEKLLTTKNAIHAKCKHLQHKCQIQEREIERLKLKMHRMAEEEEKRINRQNQVFQEFKKRSVRSHNTMDDKLLDVIDSYEKQIQNMQRELDYLKMSDTDNRQKEVGNNSLNTFNNSKELFGESFEVRIEDDGPFSSAVSGTSQNIKALIRSYEKQLKDANRTIKKLEEERDLVKLDMGSRPEVGDYRVAQQRVKKLEKLLSVHNISVPGDKPKRDPYRLKKKYSTKLEDLDYLPLDFCRQYLKDVASEVEVDDLEHVTPSIQKLRDQLVIADRFEQFSESVRDLLQEGDKPTKKASPGSKLRKKTMSENDLRQAYSTLEQWQQDQQGLEEVQLSLNKLSERIAPWLKIRLPGDASVARIIAAVDKLVYDDGIVRENDGKEHPSRTVLENIVQHFQTLFDVPSVSGVFPRMNDIYTKLGEVHNVLNTLRNLLGLESDTKSTDIVDAVGRLCQSHSNTTSQQLKALLQTEDLDGFMKHYNGVIRRLEEHNNFFPAFREIMSKLFEILDIQRMDQVIPAVRALKLLAS